ncbi:hypothetical protein [Dipodfec virus UA23Rod_1071]|uniref:Uncharacterized protein n=1 Tax=Dipodfec virus UA23Rod_1071 TaxID=2929326 RepID=A0A976R7M3_9VIRU|nr:hypothetical protein [Dipodfec virus UA23Rod_1071]
MYVAKVYTEVEVGCKMLKQKTINLIKGIGKVAYFIYDLTKYILTFGQFGDKDNGI